MKTRVHDPSVYKAANIPPTKARAPLDGKLRRNDRYLSLVSSDPPPFRVRRISAESRCNAAALQRDLALQCCARSPFQCRLPQTRSQSLADDICAKFARRQFPVPLDATRLPRRRLPRLASDQSDDRFAPPPRGTLAFRSPAARDFGCRESRPAPLPRLRLALAEVAAIFGHCSVARMH